MDLEDLFLHLGRFALEGRKDEARVILKRARVQILKRRPDLGEEFTALLKPPAVTARGTSPTFQMPLPVDLDSRLELVRRETLSEFEFDPTWPAAVADELITTVQEREKSQELTDAGLSPTRSMLFVGPPGVGKTLAARWLAWQLKRPLLTLDLAAVMSSFLGRTGNNIRTVLNYAQQHPCVLLLDEFDAIAKKRDDDRELGELKRLVTVLLQSVDDWPADSLLIAATNHPELLDPAVWRRFERIVTFPLPSGPEVEKLINTLLSEELRSGQLGQNEIKILALALRGTSFSEVTRQVTNLKRTAIIHSQSFRQMIPELISRTPLLLGREERGEIVRSLHRSGINKAEIARKLGISRPTINKDLALESST